MAETVKHQIMIPGFIASNGRVMIPVSIRKMFNLKENTPLIISADESGIHIIKMEDVLPTLPTPSTKTKNGDDSE